MSRRTRTTITAAMPMRTLVERGELPPGVEEIGVWVSSVEKKLFINAFIYVDIIIHAPLVVVGAALVVGPVWGEGERERK